MTEPALEKKVGLNSNYGNLAMRPDIWWLAPFQIGLFEKKYISPV